ncbi:MAG: hypothetical protein JWN73_1895 [Betaproteobacteria bacterium]|nr:hypothetical protein [Betaproteobacteria bacterium]
MQKTMMDNKLQEANMRTARFLVALVGLIYVAVARLPSLLA